MVNVVCRVLPRHVMAADSIVVSCALTIFDRASFATRSATRFGNHVSALGPAQDHDKFSESLVANYPQLCVERNVYMIDCRQFRHSGNDKTLRSHVGLHPRILPTLVEGDEYGDVQRNSGPKLDRIMKGHNIFHHDLQERLAPIRRRP